MISSNLINLGFTRLLEGEAEQAETLSREAVALLQERGLRDSVPYALDNLGWAALARGDLERARDWFGECLSLCREVNNRMVATRTWRVWRAWPGLRERGRAVGQVIRGG